MAAQNTVRICGPIHVFRFVEGICLHQKSRQIRYFFSEKTYFDFIFAQYVAELPLIKVPRNQQSH